MFMYVYIFLYFIKNFPFFYFVLSFVFFCVCFYFFCLEFVLYSVYDFIINKYMCLCAVDSWWIENTG